MAKSMTGYGRGEFELDGEVYSIEARCLNHRFIDISLRTPERFSPFDLKIREEIKKRFARGSFSVFINLVSKGVSELKLNPALVELYRQAGQRLKEEFGVSGEVDIPTLLRMKEIFTAEKRGPLVDSDWEAVNKALSGALGQVEEWRKREGAALKDDLLSKLSAVEGLLFGIEARLPKVVEAYRERITADMEKLIGGTVDPARILLEAAVFAERADVNEEVVRLKSHLELFRKFLKFDEPVGKRLDFLCQEIGREVNTIGSKPSDVKITQTVVEMKGEVEKIREQVQNIE
ncbi:MAG: YicC/YloC family endoribonuclease [Deltaproteobacteria bacterium]|nr:YicC/YloC family endoribonuclease [Deltaproteobacteria bacterium]